jgi:hypothetical protein
MPESALRNTDYCASAGERGPHRARRRGTGGEDRRPGPHDHGCRTAPRGVHLTGVHGAAVRVTGRTPVPLPLPRGPSPHRRRRARGQVRGAGGGALRRPQYLVGGRGVGPGSPPARAIAANPAPPNALRRGCARRETSRRPSGACPRKVRTGTPSRGRSETNLGSRARGTTAQTGSGGEGRREIRGPRPASGRLRAEALLGEGQVQEPVPIGGDPPGHRLLFGAVLAGHGGRLLVARAPGEPL